MENTVYLVVLGYDYEGENILAAFKTLESSKLFCQNYMVEDKCDWSGPWVAGTRDNIWECGSKYLLINEINIEN